MSQILKNSTSLPCYSMWRHDVNRMHKKYGVHKAVEDMTPEELHELMLLRIGMTKEELEELIEAFSKQDAEGVVDALIDLIVFAIGTLDILDVDADKAWDVVMAANMSKTVGVKPGRPNPLGLPDLIKPAGWVEPSHADNLGITEKCLTPPTITLVVSDGFIKHRSEKFEQYNQRGRTARKFLMDLDAELLEYHKLVCGEWRAHNSWMVDAIDERGRKIDVKFIRKFWNVSREKALNLLKQRTVLDGYMFMEWVSKPSRPLRAGDEVEVRQVGYVSYDNVTDNLRKSFKEPDGFYVDVRKIIQS